MSDETAKRAVKSMVRSELMLGDEIAPLIEAISVGVEQHAQYVDEGGEPPIPSAHIERAIQAAYELRATLETLR